MGSQNVFWLCRQHLEGYGELPGCATPENMANFAQRMLCDPVREFSRLQHVQVMEILRGPGKSNSPSSKKSAVPATALASTAASLFDFWSIDVDTTSRNDAAQASDQICVRLNNIYTCLEHVAKLTNAVRNIVVVDLDTLQPETVGTIAVDSPQAMGIDVNDSDYSGDEAAPQGGRESSGADGSQRKRRVDDVIGGKSKLKGKAPSAAPGGEGLPLVKTTPVSPASAEMPADDKDRLRAGQALGNTVLSAGASADNARVEVLSSPRPVKSTKGGSWSAAPKLLFWGPNKVLQGVGFAARAGGKVAMTGARGLAHMAGVGNSRPKLSPAAGPVAPIKARIDSDDSDASNAPRVVTPGASGTPTTPMEAAPVGNADNAQDGRTLPSDTPADADRTHSMVSMGQLGGDHHSVMMAQEDMHVYRAEVTIAEATDVPRMDAGGLKRSDPYSVVRLGTEEEIVNRIAEVRDFFMWSHAPAVLRRLLLHLRSCLGRL